MWLWRSGVNRAGFEVSNAHSSLPTDQGVALRCCSCTMFPVTTIMDQTCETVRIKGSIKCGVALVMVSLDNKRTTAKTNAIWEFSAYLSVVSYSDELDVVLGEYRSMGKYVSEVCQHWLP